MTRKIIALFFISLLLCSSLCFNVNAASYSKGNYTVTASSGVNVRKGAGTNYQKVGAAKKHTTFNVTKINGSWGYTSSISCTTGKKSGWILLSNCKSNTPSKVSSSKTTSSKKTVTENKVVYTYVTVNVDTSSMNNWIESMKKSQKTACKNGAIMAAKVKSTKTVTWYVPKYAVIKGPGISGTIKTKYKVPSVIEYKVHTHTKNKGYGSSIYYAQGCIKTVFTCNCGYRKELASWEIPFPDPKGGTQNTKTIIQGLPKF